MINNSEECKLKLIKYLRNKTSKKVEMSFIESKTKKEKLRFKHWDSNYSWWSYNIQKKVKLR